MPKTLEQFLNGLGESKNNFASAEKLSSTASSLFKVAGQFVTDAVNNLNKAGKIASGALQDSISVTDFKLSGSIMSVGIKALYYYKIIDEGAKFTSKMPPVDAIKKWLQSEKGKIRNTKKAIFKREKNRKRIEKIDNNSLAWAIAKSIKKRGLKPTRFWTKALNNLKKNAKKDLVAGYKIDIIDTLKEGFK